MMRIPMSLLITLLEQEMTEQKCDELAKKVASFVQRKAGGLHGKVIGGIVYGGIDAATPEALFAALREIFPSEHEVVLTESDLGYQPAEREPPSVIPKQVGDASEHR